MSHECSMCEQKAHVKALVDVNEYHELHPLGGPEVKVWYCKKCQLIDIETNTTIASLFQGVL